MDMVSYRFLDRLNTYIASFENSSSSSSASSGTSRSPEEDAGEWSDDADNEDDKTTDQRGGSISRLVSDGSEDVDGTIEPAMRT